MDRVEWTQKQDEFIQDFLGNRQKTCWDEFSQKMSEFLKLPKKTGNQCQQRYQQIVGQNPCSKIDWNLEQQQILIKKYRQMGNKWAAISQYLIQKNDNCVKNHFYSRLRKMIRKLNRIVPIYFKKSFKAIPNTTIYKLVQSSEERFNQKPICSSEVSIASRDVISKMLKISFQEELTSGNSTYTEKSQLEEYKELIQEIINANKNYKKKSKKIKNSAIKAPLRKARGHKANKIDKQVEQEYIADQSQSQSEKQIRNFNRHVKNQPRFFNDIGTEQLQQEISAQAGLGKGVQIKEGHQMQQLLKNIGFLHQGKKHDNPQDGADRQDDNRIRSYSDFQNPSGDLSFFDDSNSWKKQTRMFSRMNKRLFGDNNSQIQGS